MTKTTEITEDFKGLFYPKCALVFYEDEANETYIEHFDMDSNGNPINVHPLTVREAERLAKNLQIKVGSNRNFLQPKGVLKTNILHTNSEKGNVIWYTKAQKRQLYFVESLGIPNGVAQVPPMLWKADKNSMSIFALAKNSRPSENTNLYYAPFFNIYSNGKVCMGTVSINIKNTASVEEFTTAWEDYFFNSYFSHLLGENSPIEGNCVTLWKELLENGNPFPCSVLKKNNITLNQLLS